MHLQSCERGVQCSAVQFSHVQCCAVQCRHVHARILVNIIIEEEGNKNSEDVTCLAS
jgi:hypothetical protein